MSESLLSNSNESNVLFTTSSPVMISLLGTERFGLGLYWKPWKLRHCDIYSDGRFVVRKKDSTMQVTKPVKILKVVGITVTCIALNHGAIETFNPMFKREIGLHIKCKKVYGLDTFFRCILSEDTMELFLVALQHLNPDQNLSPSAVLATANNQTTSNIPEIPMGTNSDNQSAMRKAITHAMDKFVIQSNVDQVKSRRGAFKWLPVITSNDLTHGSWWFTMGSILFLVASSVTLHNSYTHEIGTDDSTLSRYNYRATWVLFVISGIFFTLGSLAFVRALHSDPPMKPIFKWYHLQSDELLASWCFFFGVLPAVPYCIIYLTLLQNVELFIGGLFVVGLLVLGAYLFVLANYPSKGKTRRNYFYPVARYLCCCCCGERGLKKYFANDWLAGCWIIYYATLFATIITLGLFFSSLAKGQSLQIFIDCTTFFETLFFLIGSAYFVAGSFPDEALLKPEMNNPVVDEHNSDHEDEDDDDDSHNGHGSRNSLTNKKRYSNLSTERLEPDLDNVV